MTTASSCACARDCGCECGTGICPCDDRTGPWTIDNPSGLPAIAYRVGDFGSFRHDLVRHLVGESQLAVWRPTSGDLALQVVDWWAYVADVLTFYNERIANESYLGTAQLDVSVRRLVSVLGYRPRPGIGARGTLAVIAAHAGAAKLPDRFAVASKATPDVASQTFEMSGSVTFEEPTSVDVAPPDDIATPSPTDGPPDTSTTGTADAPPHAELIVRGGVLVRGKVSPTIVGEELLLRKDPWNQATDPAAVVTVTGLVTERDPHGRTNTRVLLHGSDNLVAQDPDPAAKDYRLQRATRASHLVTVPAGSAAAVVQQDQLVLDSTARYLRAGDPLLVERANGPHDVVRLESYAEVVWFANGTSVPPTDPKQVNGNAIPLVVAQLGTSGVDLTTSYGGGNIPSVVVRSGWTDVGTLLETPCARVDAPLTDVRLARAPAAEPGVAVHALVEDVHGQGVSVTATPDPSTPNHVALGADAVRVPSTVSLQPPLRVLWDLIDVTRGESVRGERLGTGNATIAGQDFQCARKPVTYLADGTGAPDPSGAVSRSGDGYSSTIELYVDGVRWIEVPMLFGRRPSERVFSTYEDDAGTTHVRTGDGVNGARLHTGAAVVANYRVGSGAAVPPLGMLTQILSPVPNVAELRDPAGAFGGADPDAPDHIRTQAPRSVLTFNRAVSGDDYVAVALAAPGVSRATAVWGWDATEQRATVQVYVGDDPGAVAAARDALRLQADPNRPVLVLAAQPIATAVRLTLVLAPEYVADDVVASVRSALLDEPAGLFTPGGLAIGEPLYRSRVEQACALPGVRAVHSLTVDARGVAGTPTRLVPGDGCWFAVTKERLWTEHEVAIDA